MANYYYTIIESNKITPQIASEIFLDFNKSNRVRHFEFSEGGLVYLNSRGLPDDLEDILNKYNFTEEEIKIRDEFSYEEIL